LEGSGTAVETAVAEAGADDDRIWAEQRAGQRAGEGCVVKVSGLQTRLADIVRAAERAGGSTVGRAAHALCWITVPAADPDELVAAIGRLRAELAPLPCVVLDAPEPVRARLDVWDEDDPARLELSRRLKARFDPTNVCNPGLFVGGI
jgi:FAD/FMN-containing dehydrogenase